MTGGFYTKTNEPKKRTTSQYHAWPSASMLLALMAALATHRNCTIQSGELRGHVSDAVLRIGDELEFNDLINRQGLETA